MQDILIIDSSRMAGVALHVPSPRLARRHVDRWQVEIHPNLTSGGHSKSVRIDSIFPITDALL
ncbi:UNVERIFIED_ORG: hypothetical protein J2X79_003847 [Arthrobacter globiformis]|nr:hypothetical protein [Arthrobacter globiformis]